MMTEFNVIEFLSGISTPTWIGVFSLLLVAVFTRGLLKFYTSHLEDKEQGFLIKFLRNIAGPLQIILTLSAISLLASQAPYDLKETAWYVNTQVIILILIFAWIGRVMIVLTCELILKRFNMNVRNNLNARRIHTQVRVLRRLASAVLLIVTTSAILMVFDEIRALGVSLIASAGVAGIILGLAAQKTIGNFFTGLQIAITQPIRIDDAVVVEGEWGWIEEINLTYVVVRIWDLRRLILPITYFVDNPFQNWTRNSADILGTVILHLDYNTPVQDIRDELTRILEASDNWDGKVNNVQVTDSTDKTITIRLLVSAGDSPTAWDLRCEVREKMIHFLQDNYPESLPKLRADIADTREAA